MKKIFLTGSNGFIGENLLKKLKEKNFKVFTLKSYIEDLNNIENQISKSHFIIHCGAKTKPFGNDSNYYFLKNYLFSKKLFSIAQKYKIPVVYSSTAAIYGNNNYPINSYGWSKLTSEDFGLNYCDNFISLRYFNVYGPSKNKEKKNSLIYKILYNKIQKKKTFELFPIKISRDFIYIDDVIEANIMALETFSKANKAIYEVGTSKTTNIKTLVKKIGLKPVQEKSNKDLLDHIQFFTKAKKTKFVPNWKPKISLEKGIQLYERYLRNDN